MEDLLQCQIKQSCELAVPNGLKELMWDISREVLRAKPQDIYNFITKYLSALLVTRENLTIAAKVCDVTCHAPCQWTLEEKLKDIWINNEDVATAKEIIMEQLKGAVNEGNLLSKLIRKTNIDDSKLPAVQEAIRAAFVHHHVNQTNVFEPSPDYEDDVIQAANHTLKLYENTSPTNEEYNRMAKRIQAAYRAYGVRRVLCVKKNEVIEKVSEINDKTLKDDHVQVEIKETEKTKSTRNNMRASITTESSISLAGSYVKLPKYTPYSAHDVHAYNSEKVLKKVHSNTNFIEDTKYEQEQIRFHDDKTKTGKRRISFEALTIEEDISVADDESEGIIEELIHVEGDNDAGSELSEVNDEMEICDEDEVESGCISENEIFTMTENSNEKLAI